MNCRILPHYDIIQMADAYKRPDLCNYYCSHKCEIGHRYVPEVKVTDLSNIILETIASLNEINPLSWTLDSDCPMMVRSVMMR